MKNILKVLFLILITSVLSFSGNKKIIVDLTKQEAYAYEGDKLIYKGWISSGQPKYSTPTGRYKILQKKKEHVSNEWPKPNGGAKMPYMMRLTWSGIALHAGYTPNRPASHGCIRLKKEFAKKLYKWAKIGTKVIIKGKAPRWVARRGSGFVDYIALAKKKKYKKVYRLAKKSTKNKKVYISKRSKLVRYYAKLTHKKLNYILRKNKQKRRLLLASTKYSKYYKYKKLKELKRLNKIIWAAKNIKYKRYKLRRLAKKLHKRYRV